MKNVKYARNEHLLIRGQLKNIIEYLNFKLFIREHNHFLFAILSRLSISLRSPVFRINQNSYRSPQLASEKAFGH